MRYAFLLMLSLVGCATEEEKGLMLEPPYAPEVYTDEDGHNNVTTETRSQASNAAADVRHEAFTIAEHFCSKQSRFASIETFDDRTTSSSYVTTLVFTCR
jgi:hypothetical protein